jgi:hypothetical protein
VLSVQCHGDAAFVGQGVVAESMNLAALPHFNVGGTIRLVVNNQLGSVRHSSGFYYLNKLFAVASYTTAAIQGRSSFYASDIAKSIGSPVIRKATLNNILSLFLHPSADNAVDVNGDHVGESNETLFIFGIPKKHPS